MSIAVIAAARRSGGLIGEINWFWVIVGILFLIAEIMSIVKLIDVAKDKGCGGTGLLWFIGLFASPIVLGLYVASLPDNNLRAELSMLRKNLSK